MIRWCSSARRSRWPRYQIFVAYSEESFGHVCELPGNIPVNLGPIVGKTLQATTWVEARFPSKTLPMGRRVAGGHYPQTGVVRIGPVDKQFRHRLHDLDPAGDHGNGVANDMDDPGVRKDAKYIAQLVRNVRALIHHPPLQRRPKYFLGVVAVHGAADLVADVMLVHVQAKVMADMARTALWIGQT